MPRIASSAALSTSETKSFWRFRRTVSLSRSKEARVMMAPALRAAFTAVLSIGCMGGGGAGGARGKRDRPQACDSTLNAAPSPGSAAPLLRRPRSPLAREVAHEALEVRADAAQLPAMGRGELV